MIPIPTTAFIREADAYTIQFEPVASVDLMERAATALFRKLLPKLLPDQKVFIFAGRGNNGGDGLVLARLLIQQAFNPDVFVLEIGTPSPDFSHNLARLRAMGKEVQLIQSESDFPEGLPTGTIVVDALFGSGLTRPLTGLAARLVEYINSLDAVVIAVDIPSGLMADVTVELNKGVIIQADYTYTFEWPKMAFFFPENEFFVGNWEIVQIGLHPDKHQTLAENALLTAADIKPMLRNRSRFSHKGTFGHGLIIAGSADKSGAAVLAARASMRSGAGLLHAHLPGAAVLPFQSQLPEVMISRDVNENYVSQLPGLDLFTAIGIGPGIGQATETANTLKLLIQQSKVPMVLDADALNLLAANPTWLAFLPKQTILTPHPGEFVRLAGKAADSFERHRLLRNFAIRHGLIVVLKGAFTSIALPDGRIFFNPTGNPGMATGGSGDVLTGIILGLLAQSFQPVEAALAGVYLHGLAGDLALASQSQESLLAGDITENLGKAFDKLRQQV